MKQILLFLIFIFALSFVKGQVKRSITKNNSKQTTIQHFKVTCIKHGFCPIYSDSTYKSYKNNTYILVVNIKNQTNLKLSKLEFFGHLEYNSIHGQSIDPSYIREYKNGQSIYEAYSSKESRLNDNWLPQESKNIALIFTYNGYDEIDFNYTPDQCICHIQVNAHNIDKEFNEYAVNYDIIDDWKDYQRFLGLRDGISKIEKHKTITYSPSFGIDTIEEKTYNWVKLGTQTWMIQNLKETKYNDGTIIPNACLFNKKLNFEQVDTAYYCSLNCTTNNDSINLNGLLYNWKAVKSGKLCPKKWHIPQSDEWQILENYIKLYGYTEDNNVAISLAVKNGWKFDAYNWRNKSGFNKSGFTAIPTGFFETEFYEYLHVYFKDIREVAKWWSLPEKRSPTIVSTRSIIIGENNLKGPSFSTNEQTAGFSVRCVKD